VEQIMAYRLRPGVPLLLVKDREGGIKYHYANGATPTSFGPTIEWLNDEQRTHFLRLNLVEEIPDEDAAPEGLACRPGGQR
jgi:hypothetical protein